MKLRPEEKIKRLKNAARERWGDAWTIHTLRFADGSTKSTAYHSRSLVGDPREGRDETILERDRLVIADDGRLVYEREHVQKERSIDVRERELIHDPTDS